MKIKIRCKSGVVAMNFRRKSKGSFECSREASYLVSNFMCEKGDLKFVNVLSVRIPKRFKYGTALSLLQANNTLRAHLFCRLILILPGLTSTASAALQYHKL